MKVLQIILFWVAFVAFAADAPTKTKPVPVDKQEELSRALLDAKDAQIGLMQSPAWQALQSANARIEKLLTELEKQYGAPGCKLTKEKTWECQTPTTPMESATPTPQGKPKQ